MAKLSVQMLMVSDNGSCGNIGN